MNEFTSINSECYGSNLYRACKNIGIDFFHNKPSDAYDNIFLAKDLVNQDSRFMSSFNSCIFSSDAKFFRGCLRVYRNLIDE